MFSDKSLWARLMLRIYGCVQSWDFILYRGWEFIVMFESSWTRSLLSGWEFMDTFIVVRLRVYGHVYCWVFMDTFMLSVYGHVHCWVFINTFVNEIMNMLALRGSKHFNYWEVIDIVIATRLYRQDEEFPEIVLFCCCFGFCWFQPVQNRQNPGSWSILWRRWFLPSKEG